MGYGTALGLGVGLSGLVVFTIYFVYRRVRLVCADKATLMWPIADRIELMKKNEDLTAIPAITVANAVALAMTPNSPASGLVLGYNASSPPANTNNGPLVLPYHVLHLFVSCLPQFALVHCLSLAAGFHWQEITSTVCLKEGMRHQPLNILPSISATIGDNAITRQVWGGWIGLYIGLRLPSIIIFYYSFSPVLVGSSRILLWTKLVLHMTEQLMLLGLTVVTSRENLLFHQIYFALFWIASICCLSITTWINAYAVGSPASFNGPGLKRLQFAYRWRKFLLFVHLVSSVSAIYWYVAHETYCEDYYYTYFSVSEWMLVLSNIYFHVAEIFEAYDIALHIQRQPAMGSQTHPAGVVRSPSPPGQHDRRF